MYQEDTITAISTPLGTGGIGIVRMSGSRSFDIAAAIFKGKTTFNEIPSHTIHYGKIIDPRNAETLDEVLLTKMKAPKTFTREDVVEINCHGGLVVLKAVLELVVRQGARIAEPGEFTKRAFLNGRMDLSQAEAVIDLLNAKTREGSRAAVEQLEGKLSARIGEARKKLVGLIAHIEAVVDFPEHDIEDITGEQVYAGVKDVQCELAQALRSFDRGRILREGIRAVIVGRPNAGKSSLLNELTGKNRAIVTEIPGTTRDVIEEYISIGGIPVRILDTAGIRETGDRLERMGVERSWKEIEAADLVLMMVDAAEGLQPEDLEILQMTSDKKILVILNKMDLVDKKTVEEMKSQLLNYKTLATSMIRGEGIEELENAIDRLFHSGQLQQNEEVLLTNVRHKELIEKAAGSLKEAAQAYETGLPLDCITIDLLNAAEYLGQITGESVSEDVLHEIFSRFCVGK